MEPLVYLFSKNGWLSKSSQFTSDLKQAAGFSLSEGLERCRNYKSNSIIVVPVRAEDLP